MASSETVTLTRAEYDALIARNEDLEDSLAALQADDGSRIPDQVARAIMGGERPLAAFRSHLRLTLRDLSHRTGVSASYLSEIERGLKPGTTASLSRIARELGTTIDGLVND